MMKVLYFAALIGLCLAKVDYTGHKVYRAYPDDAQIRLIQHVCDDLQLDVWSAARHSGDFFDFRVPPKSQKKIEAILAKTRIEHEVMIENVQHLIDNERSQRHPRAGILDYYYYKTYEEIQQWVVEFSAQNSELVSFQTIGGSYEGRPIYAVKISDGTAGNPEFVINCGIHAREWVTPAACMKIADMLVTDFGKGNENVQGVDFYIIPTANPDGYHYTWEADRMWRKTRSPCNNDQCVGVDPNRNFDANWSGEGASGLCCSDTYYGPSPFSEVETQTQRDFVAGLSNVKSYIDVHAYSQYWMFPYGYTTDRAADYGVLMAIGTESINAIEAVYGKKFVTGPISTVIYVASGSTADYFYDTLGIKCSWAAELRDRGRYGFNLPEDEIIPTATETYEGLKVIAKHILNGTC